MNTYIKDIKVEINIMLTVEERQTPSEFYKRQGEHRKTCRFNYNQCNL